MKCSNLALTVALIALLFGGCATQAPIRDEGPLSASVSHQPLESTYQLVVETSETFEFVGQADTAANQQAGGGMIYPATHPAVFLAGIFTHAAVQNGVTRRREAAAIEQSNLVLGSFSEQLRQLDPERILPDLHADLSFAAVDQTTANARWKLTISPVFVMSRTQDAIGVAAQVTLAERAHADAAFEADRKAKIFIQSQRVDSPSEWRDIDGERIAFTVTQLLRDTAEIAVREFSGDLAAADVAQTIRYLDNNIKQVERGRVIESTPEQITFRSLRNEIKVMPALSQ